MPDGSSLELAIGRVRDLDSLLDLLRRQLAWPIPDEATVEDCTFDWTADELALGDVHAKRLGNGVVRQLRPLSQGQPWGIFFVHFNDGQVYRTSLRQVLRRLVPSRRRGASMPAWQQEDLLFICTTQGHDTFTFAQFRDQQDRKAVLSTFGWDKGDRHIRTLCEFNLSALRYPGDPSDSEAWLKQWWSAFDVQRVSDDFFKRYEACFRDEVHKAVMKILCDERKTEEFTHLLFNRLMFCWFIQKKEWLNGQKDYLLRLLDRACKLAPPKNFYHTYLVPLFFEVLNNPAEDRRKRVPGDPHVVFEAPFLNGGLFEHTPLDSEVENAPLTKRLPNSVFLAILSNLFACYNFTVEESTPLDVQVALDPELLGTIFERFVTGRRESGSYYTPKPVVSFMCREALKGYLQSALPTESPDAIGRFVEEHDSERIADPEAALKALTRVKACDPACGSGAYLLGMLHELFDLRSCLFASKRIGADTAYQRKLEIIQDNLYGVDIAEFAANIAKLRLWLSLAVEYEGDNPQPLPNLDFKIESDDSLTAPDPQSSGQQMIGRDTIREYSKAKWDYMRSHGPEKAELKKEIDDLRAAIAEWTHAGRAIKGFDWAVEFAEVFSPDGPPERTLDGRFAFANEVERQQTFLDPEPGGTGMPGFDIVLANPPYVRQERIKDQKPALKSTYGELYCGTADYYVYFYIRALQLLKPGGMLAFISSNKWFRANYGEKLRKHIADTCSVRSITDFGELPVFSAATFPMIFVAQKGETEPRDTVFTQVKSLDAPYPDVLALVKSEGSILPSGAINGPNWTLTDAASAERLRKMEKAGTPLGEYVRGVMFRGPVTGLNAAFYITRAKMEELIAADPRSSEIIKPLAVGDDIRRWHIRSKDRWLIFTRRGINIDRYPAVKKHLAQWRHELEPRPQDWPKDKEWPGRAPGDYKWYELQASPGDTARFEKPKIVYPDIAKEARFAYDESRLYINDLAFVIPSSDLFLLGVLNSACVWDYLGVKGAVLGDAAERGRVRLKSIYMRKVPVPTASDTDRAAIATLVQKCLDAKGVGCEEWEKEMDERVAGLYGL
jgi:hypothetical protein